ncbi:MAG: sugar transferase [Chloroflexota bacterium]
MTTQSAPSRPARGRALARAVKRALDVLVSATLLLAFAPVLLVVALVVRLKLGRPVFFRQRRPGLGGQPFTMIKFRTMLDARDAQGNLLPEAQRLTPFGAWLRSTSLDELPELWNVLVGHMSLVGPRPLLMQYLGRYSPEQFRRHAVRPGLTGWAQVNGRNAVTWDERFRLDLYYVDHWSLGLDLRVLWRTLAAVARREGITRAGGDGMPEFSGNMDVKE